MDFDFEDLSNNTIIADENHHNISFEAGELELNTIQWVIISERPISQRRGSAEPNRFGQFDRRFGRTVRPNFSHFWPIFWSNVWSKIDQHTTLY